MHEYLPTCMYLQCVSLMSIELDIGAGNRTLVLGSNNKCSEPLSHLSSTWIFVLGTYDPFYILIHEQGLSAGSHVSAETMQSTDAAILSPFSFLRPHLWSMGLQPTLKVILVISLAPVCSLSQAYSEMCLHGDLKSFQIDYQGYSSQFVCILLQLMFMCTKYQRIYDFGEKLSVFSEVLLWNRTFSAIACQILSC